MVTGASRGAGRGIAAALVANGWRVYLTGRTVTDPATAESRSRSTTVTTPRLPRSSSGWHTTVADWICWSTTRPPLHDELTNPKPFWEKPLELADVLDVGLRSAYVASWHAAPLLVRRQWAHRVHVVAGIGVLHARPGLRRAESGHRQDGGRHGRRLRRTPALSTVSIWMGILLTEKLPRALREHPDALRRRPSSTPKPRNSPAI